MEEFKKTNLEPNRFNMDLNTFLSKVSILNNAADAGLRILGQEDFLKQESLSDERFSEMKKAIIIADEYARIYDAIVYDMINIEEGPSFDVLNIYKGEVLKLRESIPEGDDLHKVLDSLDNIINNPPDEPRR